MTSIRSNLKVQTLEINSFFSKTLVKLVHPKQIKMDKGGIALPLFRDCDIIIPIGHLIICLNIYKDILINLILSFVK